MNERFLITHTEYLTDGKKHVIYLRDNKSTAVIDSCSCFYCKFYYNGICSLYKKKIEMPKNIFCSDFENR